jgi:RPA family protein
MNAYLWHVDGNVRHHLRAETVAEARERIAATHGEETAQRAVIRSLETAAPNKPESAAA